ncbi:hypothetical protein CPT03_02260 [Pedobacter ginsengisoli]|uniref:Lanthionine synthetase n=1 Tax=Pedobacter ginsengisoli TaxID=363852 RepID=A0A2D1U1A2_9SPHI|nr:lanthionine synthetase LanC family protein [Pedobacter ginsengisoli]ATP55369.1 hypothetical protein CPT03_02260 [Pedobacter ginsengisoli]
MKNIDNKREMITDSIHHIYKVITNSLKYINKDSGALLNSSGCCLFLYHYYKCFGDEEAKKLLNEALKIVLEGEMKYSYDKPSSVSFCSGIIGTGWITMYLNKEGVTDFDDEMSDLDDIAVNFFNQSLNKGNYDFLHGAGGALFYMASKKMNEKVITYIKEMVNSLLNVAVNENEVFFWEAFDFETEKKQNRVLNLGLSHGTPALLVIFSKIYTLSEDFAYLKETIENCANTIIRAKNVKVKESMYSYSTNIDTKTEECTRLGWCYGDLGVGISLWQAGVSINNSLFVNHAVEIFESASLRTNVKEAQVKDGALCHGAAGLAYIFHKYYLETKSDKLLIASDYWVDVAMDLIKPSSKLLTGKTRWHSVNGYLDSFSLLEGISGVGLSFLSRISSERSEWDNCLLM